MHDDQTSRKTWDVTPESGSAPVATKRRLPRKVWLLVPLVLLLLAIAFRVKVDVSLERGQYSSQLNSTVNQLGNPVGGPDLSMSCSPAPTGGSVVIEGFNAALQCPAGSGQH